MFWTPAFAGVTPQETFYETINFESSEALAKLLKARRKGHSGQAKHDPESRIFKQFWIPAFAGMTAQVTFARTSSYFDSCPGGYRKDLQEQIIAEIDVERYASHR